MSEISRAFRGGAMHFIGLIDNFSAHGNLGDVAVYKDETYFYNGTDWEKLATVSELGRDEKQKKKVITQCRNCGAATDKNGWCPYCGTYN